VSEEVSTKRRREQLATDVVRGLRSVKVVLVHWHHSRAFHAIEEARTWRTLREPPGDEPCKLALDEADLDALGHVEAAREAVPLLADAQA
jgi:hypothetical protein